MIFSPQEPSPRQGIDVSPLLTTHADKARWYGRDTYFIECLEQVCGFTDDVIEFAHGCAVLLLKPEAVVTRQLIPAVDWLGANGFRVVAAEPVRLTRTMVRALWYFQWNLATPQRRRLADLLVEMGDCLVVVVRCADRPPFQPASVLLTTLKGPTNPQARSPGQLRHLLGGPSYLLNVAHTADEPADVLRELGVYFDESRREKVIRAAVAGRHRSREARAFAERMYAATPPRDLDFEAALRRLRVAAFRYPALDPAAPPGQLVEAALRSNVNLDPWDLMVVGSRVLPMRRDGWEPVLDGSSAQEWRAHLADQLAVAADPLE